MDLVYLVLVAVFYAATVGLVAFCARQGKPS
jgi:hypothetical protein